MSVLALVHGDPDISLLAVGHGGGANGLVEDITVHREHGAVSGELNSVAHSVSLSSSPLSAHGVCAGRVGFREFVVEVVNGWWRMGAASACRGRGDHPLASLPLQVS
jgi:hypothetical protein